MTRGLPTTTEGMMPTSLPSLHFTPVSGWINDPLGLTFHRGLYHLFYQYVPDQIEWSPRCWWGHATSEDLFDWTERSPILEPGDGDDGCWSGSLVVGDIEATIFYTSVREDDLNIGSVRVAYTEDPDWNHWRKGDLLPRIEPTSDAVVFRDPFLTKIGDSWLMLVGSGRKDETATALGYWSHDLRAWEPAGEFASRSGDLTEPIWTGTVWECPQLLAMGDSHVLLFSVWEPWQPHYEAYAVGRLDPLGQFHIEGWGRLTYGDCYYAGSVFKDAADRAGIIYWLRGTGDPAAKWAGAHSLPHVLRLDDTGTLRADPHPNLADRRHLSSELTPIAPARLLSAADIQWITKDVAPDARLQIDDDQGNHLLIIDVNQDELAITTPAGREKLPPSEETRVVIDGPIVEVFTRRGVFASTLPTAAARTIGISGGSATIHALRAPARSS